MTQTVPSSLLAGLSNELAGVVERAAPSVVRVEDGSRLTATGLVWSGEGVIVTTSHGVERDDNLSIETADGSLYRAQLLGRDLDTDIAVLRADTKGLLAFQSADLNDARVGHLALALGRPGTSGLQATIGVISARQETQTHGQPGYILHTDAVLYPGFSGGALVNMNGELVGMVNRMFGRGAGVAVGTPVLAQIVGALLAHGKIRRGYLGVRSQRVALPEALVKSLNLNQERGLLILQVEAGSPAEKGGLLLGDTLLAINGRALSDVDDLRQHLQANQTVTMSILRAGARQEVEVTLGATE
jgi:S1-C subfamily serine protease